MIHKLIKEKFNETYEKGDIISIPRLTDDLQISRPTALKIIGYAISMQKMKPTFTRTKTKCYELLRYL